MSNIIGTRDSRDTSDGDQEDKWGGAEDIMENPDEQRVLYAAIDSF
jgi:hypothetical protein